MDRFRIQGGRQLVGTVSAGGAKNACLPILAACLLTSEPCVLENVPDLSDIRYMLRILEELGVSVESLGENSWRIQAGSVSHEAPYDLVRKMRASVCLMGPLLGRLKKARVSLPGGCVLGHRPIDLHIKGFKKLGAKVEVEGGYVSLDGQYMEGASVFMGGRYGSTVTGTANLLMAAVLTQGMTVIESAACEPEVIDLCLMLQSMGAKISGISTPTLTIEGVESLRGTRHRLISDRIEAGTFLMAGLLPGNDITVVGLDVQYSGALLHFLEEAGAHLEYIDEQTVRARGDKTELKPLEVVTLPYPGYPTDLQAQLTTLMTLTPGMSVITERIYPSRFMHVAELLRMGADIALEGPSAIIKGQKAGLFGADVMSSDLRASAALVLAGLAAKGETMVHRIYHLDRGYEKMDAKFAALGASIERLSEASAQVGELAAC